MCTKNAARYPEAALTADESPTRKLSTAAADAVPRFDLILVWTDAPLQVPQALPLVGSLIVGRAPPPDGFAIPDSSLSRQHATFRREPDGALGVVDNNSTNGTHVNGRPVTKQGLQRGDVIRLGETVLLVGALAATDKVTAALGFAGPSAQTATLAREIAAAAATKLPALLLGETGTGKDLAARALHAQSGRKGAFVPINCSAIPSGLAESMLFGHRRGAFTGADRDADGALVAADGGTLFLDEIGDLQPDVQAKLLRALDTGEVSAVGARTARFVDARLVSATNVDLPSAIAAGTFRRDLYARLAGIVLRTRPLRERREDIVPLLLWFFEQAALSRPKIRGEAIERLLLHDWPMNAREVRAVVDRQRLHVGATLGVEHLALEPAVVALPPRVASSASSTRRSRPTREELEAVVAACEHRVAEIARQLGCDRKQVYRWLRHYGISS